MVRAAREWLVWFGPWRVVAAVVAAAVVVAGGVLAVRTPPPTPLDAGAPRVAPDAGVLPSVTLVGSAHVAATPTALVVHVAGAVRTPGVHEVAPGARVVDALDAAGGALPDAVLDALNLAAPVVDGQRVYVPVDGEVAPGPDAAADVADATAPTAPIDLNTASATQLESLPGIGPATAAAIVDDRARHGRFVSVDELVRVRGIGPAKLAAVRDLVVAS